MVKHSFININGMNAPQSARPPTRNEQPYFLRTNGKHSTDIPANTSASVGPKG